MGKSDNKGTVQNLTEARSVLRDNITDFAMEMFKKRGIKGVTMDEIASSMGISKRTIYEVFENKEELLVNGLIKKRKEDDRIMEGFKAQNLNIIEMTLVRFKYVMNEHKSICPQFFSDINKYPKVLATIDDFRKKDSEYIMMYYKIGINEGFFRDDLDYKIMDMVITKLFDYMFTSEIFMEYDFTQIYKNMTITYLRGISTSKGLEIIENFLKEYNNKI